MLKRTQHRVENAQRRSDDGAEAGREPGTDATMLERVDTTVLDVDRRQDELGGLYGERLTAPEDAQHIGEYQFAVPIRDQIPAIATGARIGVIPERGQRFAVCLRFGCR